MKFSARTIQILKNFNQINPSIVFSPGNTLATISPMSTVMAKATIAETIPQSFAIFDLARFLGVLSLFEDPDLEFSEQFIVIKSGTQTLNYLYADSSHVKSPPDKEIDIPNDAVEKNLTAATLQSLMKAVAVLQLPDIAFTGKDGKVLIEALDTNPKAKGGQTASDNFAINIGDTTKQFKMVVKPDNMKLLNGDYALKISSKRFLYMQGTDVKYWIACEDNSVFAG
jgi:hypothetical protein